MDEIAAAFTDAVLSLGENFGRIFFYAIWGVGATWTPNPDGTVRQHWEISSDAGKSWTTAFDGLYRRAPPKP